MQNVHEVIDRDGKALRSPDLFHPGYILKEEIEAREIAKKDFAELLNVLPTHLSDVFAGKRPIGPKMARRLERALEISAGFWLRMQADYDLKLAEQEIDPVLERIEHIVDIQQRSNTTLAKAMVVYEVTNPGVWMVREKAGGYKKHNTKSALTTKSAKVTVGQLHVRRSRRSK